MQTHIGENANVHRRQHEHNGSDKETVRICWRVSRKMTTLRTIGHSYGSNQANRRDCARVQSQFTNEARQHFTTHGSICFDNKRTMFVYYSHRHIEWSSFSVSNDFRAWPSSEKKHFEQRAWSCLSTWRSTRHITRIAQLLFVTLLHFHRLEIQKVLQPVLDVIVMSHSIFHSQVSPQNQKMKRILTH